MNVLKNKNVQESVYGKLAGFWVVKIQSNIYYETKIQHIGPYTMCLDTTVQKTIILATECYTG